MLRSLVRSIASSSATAAESTAAQLSCSRTFASKNSKSPASKGNTSKSKFDPKSKTKPKPEEITNVVDDLVSDFLEEDVRARRLAEDENNKSLDVGPNGRPLFTSTASLTELTRKDTCSYMKFRYIYIYILSVNCFLKFINSTVRLIIFINMRSF
ncbi:hypothetical protein LguiB_007619 [Lonicera macranthoides]